MKILVLCTGNSCRSQMAEAMLQNELGSKGKVYSAGLNPQSVNPFAITVMQELGIDISQNKSNHLDEYQDIPFDYIITVCSNAARNCPLFPGEGKKVHIPFDDPADATGTTEEITDQFRIVRDQIKEQLLSWLDSVR